MNLLFEMFKDKCITNTQQFRKMVANYKLSNNEITDLYRKIVNYQIKKYGTSLDVFVDMADKRKASINAKERRKQKRKDLGLRKAK